MSAVHVVYFYGFDVARHLPTYIGVFIQLLLNMNPDNEMHECIVRNISEVCFRVTYSYRCHSSQAFTASSGCRLMIMQTQGWQSVRTRSHVEVRVCRWRCTHRCSISKKRTLGNATARCRRSYWWCDNGHFRQKEHACGSYSQDYPNCYTYIIFVQCLQIHMHRAVVRRQ